jgi:uncharacterized membrane protein YjfL (UPF0719 family)
MTHWWMRLRGAVGMGLSWAVAWAIAGVLIGVASVLLPGLPWTPFFEVFDAPLPALAIPGFVGGALFSVVLGIAGRRRRFHELSLPRFAAWGALGGVLLTLFPFALVTVGLASTEGGKFDAGQILAVISGPFILLSAASAVGSLLLARRSESSGSLDPAADRSTLGSPAAGPGSSLGSADRAEAAGGVGRAERTPIEIRDRR